MISPEEIRKQALKWWKPFLQSFIKNEPFFPKAIDRIGKVQPGHIRDRFQALQQEIEQLYRHSKNETGKGYLVETRGKNFRRTGSHELPESIVFETADDYVQYTGRKKEWKLFRRHFELIVQTIPALNEWTLHNTLWLEQPGINWADILKVCRYFILTPRPDLYLRQLPIEIHSKFIEENTALLQSLLNFLIPGHIRSATQKRFAERYFLKFDEPLVRIRILDERALLLNESVLPLSASGVPFNKIADISIPLSDFEVTSWPAKNILIAENKMNFLTLPPLPSAIALWSGGGFNIAYLKNAEWLSDKNIFYWGDIDEHGYQILHQLRSYYPAAKSVMMNWETFDNFKKFAVSGSRNNPEVLHLLNEEEAVMYRFLKTLETGNRLEQEKIPQAYADMVLYQLFRSPGTWQ